MCFCSRRRLLVVIKWQNLRLSKNVPNCLASALLHLDTRARWSEQQGSDWTMHFLRCGGVRRGGEVEERGNRGMHNTACIFPYSTDDHDDRGTTCNGRHRRESRCTHITHRRRCPVVLLLRRCGGQNASQEVRRRIPAVHNNSQSARQTFSLARLHLKQSRLIDRIVDVRPQLIK